MTGEQERFLALHAHRVVETSQWLLNGGTLRCKAGWHSASITAQGLVELVDMGLMQPIGSAGMRITAAGLQAVHWHERHKSGCLITVQSARADAFQARR